MEGDSTSYCDKSGDRERQQALSSIYYGFVLVRWTLKKVVRWKQGAGQHVR